MFDIDKLIKEAILEKNGSKKEAYRALKSAILLAKTAKNAKSINEIDILRKLIEQRNDSIQIYEANSRKDLADIEKDQLKYLKELLPPETPIDVLEEFIVTSYPNGYSQKQMGQVINEVKKTYPDTSSKTIATIVKKHIL